MTLSVRIVRFRTLVLMYGMVHKWYIRVSPDRSSEMVQFAYLLLASASVRPCAITVMGSVRMSASESCEKMSMRRSGWSEARLIGEFIAAVTI